MRSAGATDRAADSPAKAWRRALELTAPIATHPGRTLPVVIEELAAREGDAPALVSERESLSYRALADRASRYARWALEQGLVPGDCVALLMPNRPEYMAIWLGLIRAGVVAALLNAQLRGPGLAHCIRLVSPRRVIAAAELVGLLSDAVPELSPERAWVHGAGTGEFPRVDQVVECYPDGATSAHERPLPGIEDRALYLYTSGTTGMPKAAVVSHFRLMQWSHWFAGLTGAGRGDRIYDALPLSHSVGGIVATGAALVAGGAVVVREKFSASEFWSDIRRWDCTLFAYIGELCRYVLRTPPDARDTGHRVRLGFGNGLRPDVWSAFQERFRVPRMLEFYAATEGNVALYNVEGEPGAIGRVPAFLAHRFPIALVRFDVENERPIRDDRGFCVRCGADEVGEAIGRIARDGSTGGARFEGYTAAEETERKVLHDVFEPGDAWYRTGDLMRRDARGWYYFVDRIGDTFRWKGENVSTLEVSHALCEFPGIVEAVVYGVAIPGAEGRAGMAAIVTDGDLDLSALCSHLSVRLPAYARPLFVRLRAEVEVSGTFKQVKRALAAEGYDPRAIDEPIFAYDPERQTLIRVTSALYERIQKGEARL